MQNPANYDVCVIGGGINGVGIARDAAGRGLSVLLVESRDLASATSSASTKLVHGGLRYLEYLEFRMVRESLREREILRRAAPHLVWPMRFVMPQIPGTRPYWLVRLGLAVYDLLGARAARCHSHAISFRSDDRGKPLLPKIKKGFLLSECWVDDSRLVVLNAIDAARKGARILTRTACTKLAPGDGVWRVSLKDDERAYEITAAAVVNAAGPWVRDIVETAALDTSRVPAIRLVKGSHIIVKRRYAGDHAYILQQPDRRIIFVIPYERDYTLIGTTEADYTGDPAQAMSSDAEIDYLCGAYNSAFAAPLARQDVLWSYSGGRPLLNDGKSNASAVTRDYRLHAHSSSLPPMISVFGGKLTTYRALAEKTVNLLLYRMKRPGPAWTARAMLPGGDINEVGFDAFVLRQSHDYPWLPRALVRRYARSYGMMMNRFLEGCKALTDLGPHYGDHVYKAEIMYLIRHEWARSTEDILWRRSKLGLHVSEQTVQNLEAALSALLKAAA